MKSILIVEDDIEYSFELKQLFMHDYQVDESVDGMTALAKIHSSPYDVVLLDIGILGETSGAQVLDIIKSDKKITKTLVIVLTNLGPERREEFLNQGADQYIVKSEISLPDLKILVDRLASPGTDLPK